MASQSLPVLKRLGMSFLILYIHWISNRSYRVCGLARISDEVGVWKGSAVASTAVGEEQNYVPVVIWHGMGDTASNPLSMAKIIDLIQTQLPGIFVHSISLGDSLYGDFLASYFGDVNDQVARVCDELRSIPELKAGWIGLGFSQGGQFLRAVVQRCNEPPAKRLITMGSQHQGVMDWPGCWEPSWNITPSVICEAVQKVLGYGAYAEFSQRHLVQAQYFKSAEQLSTYFTKSRFLADINIESQPQASSPSQVGRWIKYRENIISLERLVLFQFQDDTTVCPKESAHFGFWNGTKLLQLEDTDVYHSLGLDVLVDRNALILDYAPGEHMHFSLDWFSEHVILPHIRYRTSKSVVA